ncbi:unnamed protein product [Macrosiphum euphorbiae]|uniref:Uncharacterized protein n=1 Tax=Macrosiphum euphorbiae TaxID=13131 RepID=A0AAV0WF92_9HEMI|nr:unnamed protein product [Macrosiphum euphorbiae]
MLTRAQILQGHVRELMPTFQYEEFLKRPDEHVTKMLLAKKTGKGLEPDTGPSTNGDGDATEEIDVLAPVVAVRSGES